MATIKMEVQSNVELTVSGLSTLASGTYAVSSAIDHSTNDPLDVLLYVKANAAVPAGNKQLVVFAKGSLDGTNYGSGPESATTTTDEVDLHFVGVLPMTSPANVHAKVFSLASSYGGILPRNTKIVIKNDLGTSLQTGNIWYSEVWGVSA